MADFLPPMPAFASPLAQAAAAPLTSAGEVSNAPGLTPWVILIFCALAGLGTAMLLPGRRSVAWGRVGAGLVFTAGLLLLIVVLLSLGYHNVYFWAFAIIAIVGSVRVISHPQPVYSALYFVLTVFASAGLFVLAYAEFIAVALITIYAGAILVTYTFVIMLAADAAPDETGVVSNTTREERAKAVVAEHDAKARSPLIASVIGFTTAGVLLFVIFDKAPQRLEKRLSVTDARYLTESDAALRETELEAGELPPVPGEPMASLEDEIPARAAPPQSAPTALITEPTPLRGDLYTFDNRLAYAQEEDRGGVQVLGIYLFTRQMVALQVAGLILTVAMIGAIVIARRQLIPELVAGRRRDAEREGGDTMTMPFTPVNDNPKSLPVVGNASPRQKAYPQN